MINHIVTMNSPTTVSMADAWYEHTNPNHFWIRHRNAVIDRHFGSIIRRSELIGEIGCGRLKYLLTLPKPTKKQLMD